MKQLFFAPTFVFALMLEAVAEITDFEQPQVAAVPTSLPVWSGFSPVVLQYGDADVRDTLAGAGLQALGLAPDSSIAWAPMPRSSPQRH